MTPRARRRRPLGPPTSHDSNKPLTTTTRLQHSHRGGAGWARTPCGRLAAGLSAMQIRALALDDDHVRDVVLQLLDEVWDECAP